METSIREGTRGWSRARRCEVSRVLRPDVTTGCHAAPVPARSDASGAHDGAVPASLWPRLPDVDDDRLHRVVPVPEAVPGRDVGLDAAVGVGRARPERVPAASPSVPRDRPLLPGVPVPRWLDLRRLPLAVTRDAHLDRRDRPVAGPRLAPDRVLAGGDRCPDRGLGDACA